MSGWNKSLYYLVLLLNMFWWLARPPNPPIISAHQNKVIYSIPLVNGMSEQYSLAGAAIMVFCFVLLFPMWEHDFTTGLVRRNVMTFYESTGE